MEFVDSDRLQYMVHYSFGDHGGMIGGKDKIPQAFIKPANLTNQEFIDFVPKQGQVITLFIDTLRLYYRPIEYNDWEHLMPASVSDKKWMESFKDQDLLKLCAHFPAKKFIIFTALEDVPIDDTIQVPDNVLAIYAGAGVYMSDKVHPWPYGLTRMMRNRYNSQVELRRVMGLHINPTKLLYVNHTVGNGSRAGINELFQDKEWATVSPRLNYPQYIAQLAKHAFVLCPSGRGIDSARNCETLYLQRIPIFKDHPYLRELYGSFPSLFVKDWSEVTEQYLKDNLHLLGKTADNESRLDLHQMFLDRTGFFYSETP